MKKYIIATLIALFMVTIPSVKAITKPEVTDHEKIKVHVFWASWCPHCHDLIEYFSDKYNEYEDYFEIVTYQVDAGGQRTSNQKNSSIMAAVEEKLNESITDSAEKLGGGIPLTVIGDNYYLSGFGSDGTEIIEKALEEYQNANYKDLVSDIIKANNLEADNKPFQEACITADIPCVGVEKTVKAKKVSDGVVAGIIVGVIVLGFGGLVVYSRKK